MGGLGSEAAREIPLVDLTGFDERRAEVTDRLWSAATEVGFFQLAGHGIDTGLVDAGFAAAERFFALPADRKAAWPLDRSRNAGWESRSQVRPSTGTADEKESYQITVPAMGGLWPDPDELPGFRATLEALERASWTVAMRVLSCFAGRLDLPADFFTAAHDPAAPTYQSTLRLLRYPAASGGDAPGGWRAGAHTDFDCLTLLFQRAGQPGLQVCPGAERDSGAWTPVDPDPSVVTCNIGDMLMRWSDDRLLSTLHRVRGPGADDPAVDRYSIAFFAQANRDVVIESPGGTYPPITAADYLAQRVAANY
ncbi:isopenicillin N synthase family dioxygenase [Dermatobacter hominis]|uniref:isopenicillin N synthase family dioxygenase n=1 Tax=Dermatobacter hominis TaxID=2884263 RepID=UPI0035ABFB88